MKKEPPALIRNNLAVLRGRRRQDEVSEAAGISQGIYSLAETGRAILNPEALERLCRYYGVAPEKVYPAWICRNVYGIRKTRYTKPKTTVSVRIPIDLAEGIDRLCASRPRFVAEAVRDRLEGGVPNREDAQGSGMAPVQLPDAESQGSQDA